MRAGCVIGYAAEASIDPPRFLVCISKVNATFPVAMRAARLAVHALARGDVALAELFGGQTGDEIDKFSRCDWVAADDGTPILTAPRSAGMTAASSTTSRCATWRGSSRATPLDDRSSRCRSRMLLRGG